MLSRQQLQTYNNVSASLRHYGITAWVRLQTARPDRCVLQIGDEFWKQIARLVEQDLFRKWNLVKNHGHTAECGWRENVARASLQIILHKCETELCLECDFDAWNPDAGAGVALAHGLLEVFPNWLSRVTGGSRKTDPFKIRELLVKRGIQVGEVSG